MALPALIPTPKPPPREDYTGIERLDRPELDDVPDTDREPPTLPSLGWDDDGDSGVKRRHT